MDYNAENAKVHAKLATLEMQQYWFAGFLQRQAERAVIEYNRKVGKSS